MSYPAGVNLVPVVAGANGYFHRDATGSKAAGARVVFVALSGAVVVDGISLPTKLVATLDAAGQVPDTFKLPTCNDAAREIGGIAMISQSLESLDLARITGLVTIAAHRRMDGGAKIEDLTP